MDWASSDILAVLKFLLPGFVGSWAFRRVTPFEKPSDLNAIIEALIFTGFVQALAALLHFLASFPCSAWGICLASWTDNVELGLTVSCGATLGFAAGYGSNYDVLHRLLRQWRFTKSTSFPSEWYGKFFREERFVILHLRDGKRIQAWPVEWPNRPTEGQFILSSAEWLDPDGGPNVPLPSLESMLVPVSEVLYVEFLKWNDELTDESQNPAAPTAD